MKKIFLIILLCTYSYANNVIKKVSNEESQNDSLKKQNTSSATKQPELIFEENLEINLQGSIVFTVVEMSEIKEENQIAAVAELNLRTKILNITKLKTTGQFSPTHIYRLNNNDHILFSAKVTHTPCCESKIEYLDKNYKKTVFKKFNITQKNLDFHASFLTNRETLFIQKTDLNLVEAKKKYKIIEFNKNAEKQFSWSTESLNKSSTDSRFDDTDLNSVDLNGNILCVSLRNLSAIVMLEYPSGKKIAEISKETFKFQNDIYDGFLYQHSVKCLGRNKVLLFDNGNNFKNRPSRAVEYVLDLKKKTATLVWEFEKYDRNSNYSEYGGSVARLPDGNTLISWGNSSHLLDKNKNHILWSIVNSDKKVIMDMKSAKKKLSYFPIYVVK